MRIAEHKQKVKEICDKVYLRNHNQITIDLIQEDVEELLEINDPTPDDIGACSYRVSLLLEVLNPKFENDISLLVELTPALNEWCSDKEAVNRLLGLDPNV